MCIGPEVEKTEMPMTWERKRRGQWLQVRFQGQKAEGTVGPGVLFE